MSEKKPSKYWTLLAMLFASSSSILFRLSGAPAMAAAFWRLALAGLMLTPVVLFGRRQELRLLRGRTLLFCALAGVMLAVHFGAWITSLELTTVTASTLLVAMNPLFVALFTWIVSRRRPRGSFFLCVAAALLGTVLTCWGGGAGTIRGGALALLGAAGVAAYLMFGEQARGVLSAPTYAATVYFIAALALLPVCALMRVPLTGYSGMQMLCFALMAALCTIGGHTLNNYLVKYWGPQLLSLSALLEPVFSGALAFVILQEAPGVLTLVGGAVLLLSVGWYLVRNDS